MLIINSCKHRYKYFSLPMFFYLSSFHYTNPIIHQYLKFPANVNNYQVNVPDKYLPTTWTLYPGMVGRIMARLVFPQALGNAAQTNFSSPVFSLVNPIIWTNIKFSTIKSDFHKRNLCYYNQWVYHNIKQTEDILTNMCSASHPSSRAITLAILRAKHFFPSSELPP